MLYYILQCMLLCCSYYTIYYIMHYCMILTITAYIYTITAVAMLLDATVIDIINYTITVDTDCWALCDYYRKYE